MSGEKRILAIIIITILFLGCSQSLKVGKPEIRSVSNEWGTVTTSTTEIITKIDVYNPNPFPIPLKDILTEIYMNDVKMGEGSALKAEIKPSSESTIIISTKLDNSKIPEWWVSHIKNGERSMLIVKGYLVFDLKIMEFKYPFEMSNEMKTNILAELSTNIPQKGPISLTIESTRTYWGNVNEEYTEIITVAKVRNDNTIPIPVTGFQYLVEMNGIKVGEGRSEVNAVIPPKSDATLTFITKLDNKKLDEWWVSHIKNGERTTVRILLQPIVKIAGKELKFTVAEKKFEFTTDLLGS